MNETLQTAIRAGLFGVLGAALTYRWLKDTGRLTDYTRKKIWFRTLSGAAMATGAWVLFDFGMEALPDRWSKPLPFIFLIGLALIHYWNPPKVMRLLLVFHGLGPHSSQCCDCLTWRQDWANPL